MGDTNNKGGIVAGIGTLVGAGINAWSQGSMNKKTREWNEKMYGTQRADALADWTMQNDYNSPSSQMARYRDAGLNPNLIYGNMSDGATVRSATAPSWNPKAPDVGQAPQALSAMYDIKLREAQLNNLRTANTVALEDAELKRAQTKNVNANTDSTQFQLGLNNSLRDNSLQVKEYELQKLKQGNTIMMNQDMREAAKNASDLREAVARIAKIYSDQATSAAERQRILATIPGILSDNRLKQAAANMRDNGIEPGNNFFLKAAGSYLADHWKDIKIPTPKEFKNFVNDMPSRFYNWMRK